MFKQMGFPGGSNVKNPPAMQKTQVRSLGQQDPLEKGMAAHASILAWRIPWTAEPGGLQSVRSQRVRHSRALSTHTQVQEGSVNVFISWYCKVMVNPKLQENPFCKYFICLKRPYSHVLNEPKNYTLKILINIACTPLVAIKK